MSTDDKQPKIKFAGDWIPAHEVWDKMALSGAVKDVIKKFNTKFPNLSTEASRRVVPLVEERLRNFEMKMDTRIAETAEYATAARNLLKDMHPEDAIDMLAREHNCDIDLRGLIVLVGEQAYLHSLANEARVLGVNQVAIKQAALRWNELGRPAPDGGLWSEHSIRLLLEQDAGADAAG